MFKKLIPLVLIVFISACTANTQASSSPDTGMKCACCKSSKCECCQDKQCTCCTDGSCKMCRMKDDSSSADEDEQCPICAKADREEKAKATKTKSSR
jgi:hypothetical protein